MDKHPPPGGDPELERALADLGNRLAYPPTPDLAGAVRRQLHSAAPSLAAAAAPPPRPFGRRWGVPTAAILLLAATAVLALAPGARLAVADHLGLRGVRLLFVEETPSPSPLPPSSPVGAGLGLGRRLSLDEARAAVQFAVRVPTLASLGPPDDIFLAPLAADGMVSFVYRPAPGLPTSPYTGVGVLLTQFRGDTDRALIEKGLVGKRVGPGSSVEVVEVDGGRGYWIEGEAHRFFLYREGEGGEPRAEDYRLAGNVLLWERDGLTFRLESPLSRSEAIVIARSLRPSAEAVREPTSAATGNGG